MSENEETAKRPIKALITAQPGWYVVRVQPGAPRNPLGFRVVWEPIVAWARVEDSEFGERIFPCACSFGGYELELMDGEHWWELGIYTEAQREDPSIRDMLQDMAKDGVQRNKPGQVKTT